MTAFIDYAKYSSNLAFITENDQEITYGELQQKVVAAEKLLQPGLVLLECQNEIHSVVYYLAALQANCPVVLVNSKDEKNIALIKSRYSISNYCCKSGEEWVVHNPDVAEPTKTHADLAAVLSTSGSTGNAKQIKLSKKNLISNADSIVNYLAITESDKTITTLPFNYSYGLSVINSHLRAGACIVLNELSVTENEFWQRFKSLGCCSFAGVPHTYELIMHSRFEALSLPALRYFTQAGGRLAPDKVVRFLEIAQQKNAKFFVMYGQTEATARMAYLPPDIAGQKTGSIGIAIPGGRFSLLDNDAQPVTKANTEGELIYRGDNIMMGYATAEADLLSDDTPEFLRTGDMAEFDEDGIYRITGRLNRFIKPFGVRLGLDELESSLAEESMQCVCTGTDELLMVAVKTEQEILPTRQRVAELTRLPENCISIKAIHKLPRLNNGKIDYPGLKEHFSDFSGSITADQLEGTPQEKVLRAFNNRLNLENQDAEKTFRELGGDSLTYVQASIDLEKILGEAPSGWENLPIAVLAKHKTHRKNSFFSKLESSSVVRCYAVCAVVLNHAGLTFMAGGAQLLMLASGLNMARFQWSSILNGEFRSFLRSLFLNILLPYWGLMILFPLLKGADINISGLLLIINLVPGHGLVGFPAWFIAALVHCLLLTTLPTLIPDVRQWIKKHEFQYGLSLLGIAIAARLIDAYFNWGELLHTGGRQTSWVFWLFALGFLAFLSRTRKQKIFTSLLVLILPLLFFAGDYSRIVTITAGGLLLVWRSSLTVPGFLRGTIAAIGSASLFIYLLHPRAPIMMMDSLPIDLPRIVIGIVLGLVGWKLYNIGLHQFLSLKVVKRLFTKS